MGVGGEGNGREVGATGGALLEGHLGLAPRFHDTGVFDVLQDDGAGGEVRWDEWGCLWRRIKGKTTGHMGFSIGKNWILSRDSQAFYTFLRYDPTSRSLIRFAAYRIDSENHLRQILMTPRILYSDGAWIADGGWVRSIDPDGVDHFTKITSPREVEVPEGPDYFSREYRQPSEMSQGELREYINKLEESGYHPSVLVVRWYQKFTTPLSVLILMALGIPFVLKESTSRVSTMQGIGVALGLGLAYFTLLVPLFAKLGEAEFLPPLLGALGPVLIGTLVAINRLTTLRT